MFTGICRCFIRPTARKLLKHSSLEQHISNHGAVFRTLNTTRPVTQKLFRDFENEYLHGLLPEQKPPPTTETEPTPERKDIKFKVDSIDELNTLLDQNWRPSKVAHIVDAFDRVSELCGSKQIPVSDRRFDRLVDGLLDKVEHLTDAHLLNLLDSLVKFPPTSTVDAHNFHDVWSALDDVCYTKMSQWDADTVFLFADKWFRLNLARKSDFVFEALDKLARKPEKLTKDQLVRLFFFFNVCRRRAIPYEMEYELENFSGELSADELAVIALGYFKTETKVKSVIIINDMARKVIEDAHKIHEISLTAILKTIRYSDRTNCSEVIPIVLKKLGPQIERLSNVCCLHIALLGTNLQMYDEEVLVQIARKLHKDLHDPTKIRLKDIERLLFALTMFNCDVNNVYEDCVRELHNPERQKEIKQYPKCLAASLNYLSIKNIYPYDLLSQVLNPDLVHEFYGKTKHVSRELFSLDCCVEIECPDYKGHRLHFVSRSKAAKWLTEYVPKLDQYKKFTASDKLVLDVMDSVEKLTRDKKNVFVGHVLPHFSKPDVVICKDRAENRYVEPPGVEAHVLGKVLWPVKDDNLEWYSIVIVGQNAAVRNTSMPLGIMHMKARQLRTVGYKPVFVLWNEYGELASDDKVKYIRTKLSEAF